MISHDFITGGGSDESPGGEDGTRSTRTSSADEQMNDVLKEELEHTKKKKKETEDQLMGSKRENVELRSQLNSITKELEELKEDGASHKASAATLKDLEAQVFIHSLFYDFALDVVFV